MRAFFVLAIAGLAFGRPMRSIYRRQAEFALQNGQDAIAAKLVPESTKSGINANPIASANDSLH